MKLTKAEFAALVDEGYKRFLKDLRTNRQKKRRKRLKQNGKREIEEIIDAYEKDCACHLVNNGSA